MPSLICDLRPNAPELLEEYRSLRAAGESVALFWPAAEAPPGLACPQTMEDLDAAFEDERLICLAANHRLPAWLRLEDFDRVIVITEAGGDSLAFAEELLRRGAEQLELLSPGEARELRQSWHSGRRTGGRVLRAH